MIIKDSIKNNNDINKKQGINNPIDKIISQRNRFVLKCNIVWGFKTGEQEHECHE